MFVLYHKDETRDALITSLDETVSCIDHFVPVLMTFS